MFARSISVHLKSNMLSESGHAYESQVLPLLRKQKGFRDEITIVSPNGLDVTAISLWDNQVDAEAYNTNADPEVMKSFLKLIDGNPRVQTCELVDSASIRSLLPYTHKRAVRVSQVQKVNPAFRGRR